MSADAAGVPSERKGDESGGDSGRCGRATQEELDTPAADLRHERANLAKREAVLYGQERSFASLLEDFARRSEELTERERVVAQREEAVRSREAAAEETTKNLADWERALGLADAQALGRGIGSSDVSDTRPPSLTLVNFDDRSGVPDGTVPSVESNSASGTTNGSISTLERLNLSEDHYWERVDALTRDASRLLHQPKIDISSSPDLSLEQELAAYTRNSDPKFVVEIYKAYFDLTGSGNTEPTFDEITRKAQRNNRQDPQWLIAFQESLTPRTLVNASDLDGASTRTRNSHEDRHYVPVHNHHAHIDEHPGHHSHGADDEGHTHSSFHKVNGWLTPEEYRADREVLRQKRIQVLNLCPSNESCANKAQGLENRDYQLNLRVEGTRLKEATRLVVFGEYDPIERKFIIEPDEDSGSQWSGPEKVEPAELAQIIWKRSESVDEIVLCISGAAVPYSGKKGPSPASEVAALLNEKYENHRNQGHSQWPGNHRRAVSLLAPNGTLIEIDGEIGIPSAARFVAYDKKGKYVHTQTEYVPIAVPVGDWSAFEVVGTRSDSSQSKNNGKKNALENVAKNHTRILGYGADAVAMTGIQFDGSNKQLAAAVRNLDPEKLRFIGPKENRMTIFAVAPVVEVTRRNGSTECNFLNGNEIGIQTIARACIDEALSKWKPDKKANKLTIAILDSLANKRYDAQPALGKRLVDEIRKQLDELPFDFEEKKQTIVDVKVLTRPFVASELDLSDLSKPNLWETYESKKPRTASRWRRLRHSMAEVVAHDHAH